MGLRLCNKGAETNHCIEGPLEKMYFYKLLIDLAGVLRLSEELPASSVSIRMAQIRNRLVFTEIRRFTLVQPGPD